MPNFHKDSVFGDGPRVPLDRERRAQFRAKVRLQRRPGRLTIATAAVALVLVDMLGADGRLDPTIATLAALACVSVATVKRALADLKAFGFLWWQRRLVRSSGTGWRAEQTSNAYMLRVPSCEVHFAPQVPNSIFKKGLGRQSEGTEGWEAQVQEATRQLVLLGAPVPAGWGLAQ